MIPLSDFVIVSQEMNRFVGSEDVKSVAYVDHGAGTLSWIRPSKRVFCWKAVDVAAVVLKVVPYFDANSRLMALTMFLTATSRNTMPFSRDDAEGEDRQPERGVYSAMMGRTS